MNDLRTREAIRYLGYGKHAVDDQTLALISDSFQELEESVTSTSVYRIFECIHEDNEHLKIGNMKIQSKNLCKNMKGCEKAAVFGATLGTGVDRLMKKHSLTDMSRVVVLQACAAAMLEEYCDELQEIIGSEEAGEGLYMRPRFSPGYGDFDIHHQRDIIRMLDTAKCIGLSMTESFMLTPTKSVTAVIGLSRTKENCHRQGCEVCTKADCEYRRN